MVFFFFSFFFNETHVLVHRVCQLPVVVQDEPSSLPSLENESKLSARVLPNYE